MIRYARHHENRMKFFHNSKMGISKLIELSLEEFEKIPRNLIGIQFQDYGLIETDA